MAAQTDREKTGHLVLDAGAFISGTRVWEYAAKLYAVHEIRKEVRDVKARQLLDSGLFELELLEPSREAFRRVVAFARATGDYAALSAVDLKVLALTLQLEIEQNGERFIREAPKRPVFSNGALKVHNSLPRTVKKDGDKSNGKDETSEQKFETEEANDQETTARDTHELSTDVTSAEQLSVAESQSVREGNASQEISVESCAIADAELSECEALRSVDTADELAASELAGDAEDDDDDEDEGEWVTPENFVAKVLGNSEDIEAVSDEELQRVHVSCLTTDFAMQNVLLQMGLRVTSIDGLRIRRTKTWILRCIACFKVVQDRERLFCPHCGHDSLRKISVTVDENGNVHYYNSKKQINIRGTRYSLPKPKAGRCNQASQPIICEDQLLKRGNRRRKERKVDPFDPEFVFASKKRNQQAGVGVGRRGNPNESRRRGKGKKKK